MSNSTSTLPRDPWIHDAVTQPLISVSARDLRWSLLAKLMEGLLYRALQADALGVIDDVPLEAADPKVRLLVTRQAELAVRSMSSLHRDEAMRKAQMALEVAHDTSRRCAVDCARAKGGEREAYDAEQAIEQFRAINRQMGFMAEDTVASYERALLEPMHLSDRTVAVLATVRALRQEAGR